MNRLLKKINKSSFVKSVTVLAGGTILSQILIIAATPFLTRIYSPNDFGVLATFVAISTVIGVISSLRYELAIPLPKSSKEAIHLLTLCIYIVGVVSLISGVLLFFFREDIHMWANSPKLSEKLWLLPVGLFSFGMFNISNHWAIREKKFRPMAKAKLAQALGMVICQLGAFKMGSTGLLLGYTIGQTSGAFSLYNISIKKNWFLISQVEKSQVLLIAKKYYRFPLYSTWATLLHTLSSQAPNILFAYLFSPLEAGLFFLANRITSAPLSLIGGAIGQTFLSRARDANHDNTLKFLAIQIVIKLTIMIMPIAFVIAFYANDIFTLIFGAAWRSAGEMAQWLTPMIVIQFITSPVSQLLAIQGKQRAHLILILIFSFLRLIAFYVGSYYPNIITTVILFSLFSSIGYTIFLIASLLSIDKQ